MSRLDRFFLVLQRISNLLVVLFAGFALAMVGWQWMEMRRFEREMNRDDRVFGNTLVRKLPYAGQEIETADGSLIAIFQDDGGGERVEFGGITITNPTTGKSIELAPDGGANVIQFEVIFQRGDGGGAVGYLATIATPEQYEHGRMDLVVGAFPAMTRHVAARSIRYSDLPRIRGDGSVGLLMWPEDGEAELVAIRFEDGAIIERAKVKLPTLEENALSQGPGGQDGADGAAPVSGHSEW